MKCLNLKNLKMENFYDYEEIFITIDLDRLYDLPLAQSDAEMEFIINSILSKVTSDEVLVLVHAKTDTLTTEDYLWITNYILKFFTLKDQQPIRDWGVVPERIKEYFFAETRTALDFFNYPTKVHRINIKIADSDDTGFSLIDHDNATTFDIIQTGELLLTEETEKKRD